MPEKGLRSFGRDGLPIDAPSGFCHPVPTMRYWRLGTLRSRSGLTQQFGLLSFVVISLITVVLALTVTSALRRDLLAREWSTTADYIRTSILRHLSQSDFLHPEREPAQEHFEALYAQA